ncbi:MAG: DEAD/DEAH box helicase [Chitinophagales bacterium]
MTFAELNLTKQLLNALDDIGLTTPTTIQQKGFSTIMSGKDVVGIAQTGTGKTFAYLLPTLRLWSFSKDAVPTILILVPTRELVVQVAEQCKLLTKYMNVKTVGVFGGANIKPQATELSQGADVVVATPGRLLDLVLNGALDLRRIKRFIIDEVDEMMDMGFRPQLVRVIDLLPKQRQNLLFSATITDDVDVLIHDFFNFPQRIEAAPTGTPLEKIKQSAYKIPNFNTKVNFLKLLLKDEAFIKVLVFISTKRLADILFSQLENEFKEQVGIIHSGKAQNLRFDAVNKFEAGDYRILIATDIVARGLDIAAVSHVINFDIPNEPENYIHRIGRTGRADKDGIAISLVTKKDEDRIADIEALMQKKIPGKRLPKEVEISKEHVKEETPELFEKQLATKVPKKKKTEERGASFHEKKAKNQKVNKKIRHEEKMKMKYGKPKTRGQKRK